MNKQLTSLPNIGKKLEEQLNRVGIKTPDDLVKCGSQKTWLKIKATDPTACLNRLLALEGAIQNIRWYDLPDKDKERLREFYRDSK